MLETAQKKGIKQMSNKFQIFISYRRDGGESLAHLLYQKLSADGYSVFLDVESLRSGKFNDALYDIIDGCTDFLLILPQNGLDRCKDPSDWLRLEIEYALKRSKNIIPIMTQNFCFPKSLPDSLSELRNYNGIRANFEFFDVVIDRVEHQLLQSTNAKSADTEKETDSEQLKSLLDAAYHATVDFRDGFQHLDDQAITIATTKLENSIREVFLFSEKLQATDSKLFPIAQKVIDEYNETVNIYNTFNGSRSVPDAYAALNALTGFIQILLKSISQC